MVVTRRFKLLLPIVNLQVSQRQVSQNYLIWVIVDLYLPIYSNTHEFFNLYTWR
jgi:hypothetical protein